MATSFEDNRYIRTPFVVWARYRPSEFGEIFSVSARITDDPAFHEWRGVVRPRVLYVILFMVIFLLAIAVYDSIYRLDSGMAVFAFLMFWTFVERLSLRSNVLLLHFISRIQKHRIANKDLELVNRIKCK